MTVRRTRTDRGWVSQKKLEKLENGKPPCRQCGGVIEEKRRRTFCSDQCVHEWKLRSDVGYLRQEVYRRDRGVCARCGMDASHLRKIVDRHRREMEQEIWGDRAVRSHPLAKAMREVLPGHRSTFWDADHIVEVADGGGECGLDNMETLCYWCHVAKTTESRKKRKQARASGKNSQTK